MNVFELCLCCVQKLRKFMVFYFICNGMSRIKNDCTGEGEREGDKASAINEQDKHEICMLFEEP